MSDASVEQIAQAGGFIAVECCGEIVGYANPKPFSKASAARFEEIRQRHVSPFDPLGNAWSDDPEAKALIADPSAHATPDDGTRMPFSCKTCGAAFVWAGGSIRRLSKEEVS